MESASPVRLKLSKKEQEQIQKANAALQNYFALWLQNSARGGKEDGSPQASEELRAAAERLEKELAGAKRVYKSCVRKIKNVGGWSMELEEFLVSEFAKQIDDANAITAEDKRRVKEKLPALCSRAFLESIVADDRPSMSDISTTADTDNTIRYFMVFWFGWITCFVIVVPILGPGALGCLGFVLGTLLLALLLDAIT